MSYLLTSLREHPELAIFLTLAIGFVIGRIKIGSFKFGNVLGTLIAGVLIGQLDIKVDRHGQVGLLLAVPVCHRLQGRTAVLSRLEEECDVPGRADGRPLRDQPGDDAGGGEAAELRHRDRGRPDGRGVHRIDGDRHRQRHDRPARSAGGREDETEEQHSRGLCGQLPGGHGIRRLVSVGRGATPAARRHEGGEPETGDPDVGGRRRLGPGSSPGVQGMEHPCLPARRRRGGPDRGGFRTCREPRARLRRAHPPRDRAARCHADDGVAVGRCAGHRRAAQSAAQRQACRFSRSSRTPGCSTSQWRRSTSW